MRRVSVLILMLLIVCFAFAGCKARPGGGSGSGYTLLYSPGDHVVDLVQEKKFSEVSKVYGAQQEWFAANADDAEVNTALSAASSALQTQYAPGLNNAMAPVRGQEWPVGSEQWGVVKQKLEALAASIHDADAVELFHNPKYAFPLLGQAKQLLRQKQTDIAQYAPSALAVYPVHSGESFFEVYPVDLNDAAFLAEQKAIWSKNVTKADAQALLHMHREYGNLLPDEMQKELASAYFTNLCPDVSKANLDHLMRAFAKVGEAGMHLDSIPGVEIAFVEVTSDTLKKKGVIEFPVAVDLDMPFKAVSSNRGGLNSKEIKDADIVILFNLAATKTDRRVDTSNYIKSTYRVGYRKVNNPEWDIIQVELQQANTEIITTTSQLLNTSTADPFVNMANSIANIGKQSDISDAKDNIEKLKEKMRTTPRMIDEPVYDTYAFQRVEMDVTKAGSVQYYVIDQRKKQYFKDFFDVRSREFFTVAYDLSETDPALDDHLSTNVTEEIVDDFEKEAVTVKLSELLTHYTANNAKARKYASMDVIQEDIVKNRNVAVTLAKSEEYGIDKRQDKRFDSVVIVKGSKSLGTGFYVTSDLVLTNYHVVKEQKFIELIKWDEVETFGKVICKDVRLDLALVKVQDRGEPVRFYSQKQIGIGETVEAIGHPHGQRFTLTRGVVSTVREHPSIMGVKGKPVLFIQTDTPVNPGNSGGPLFLGEAVIGVNDWVVNKDIAEGLNFSIHYSEVFKFLKDNQVAYKVVK